MSPASEQAGAEDRPRPEPGVQDAHLVDAAGDVAQRDRGAGESPPTKPPPGWLWPANSSYSEPTSTAWKITPHRHVDEDPRASIASSAPCGASAAPTRPAPGAGERDRADRRGGEHGDLAQRVEAAEVDEDHVDDVAAVAVGHRPLDHLGRDRLGRP